MSTREATAAQLAIIERWIRAEYAMRTHAIEAGITNVDWLLPDSRICLTEIVSKAAACGFPADKMQLSQLMQRMARGLLRAKRGPVRFSIGAAVQGDDGRTGNVLRHGRDVQGLYTTVKYPDGTTHRWDRDRLSTAPAVGK